MAYVFTTRDIAIAVLGFFLPPIAVLLREGCGIDFCINLLLTLLGYVFGGRSLQWRAAWHSASVAHCWYIVLRHAHQRAIRQGYDQIGDIEQGNSRGVSSNGNDNRNSHDSDTRREHHISPVVVVVASKEEAQRVLAAAQSTTSTDTASASPVATQDAPPATESDAGAGPSTANTHDDPPPVYTPVAEEADKANGKKSKTSA